MEFFNEMTVSFKSLSINESFARVTVASFVASLDPILEDLADIKTAVSEAVTNSIIHGYEGKEGVITIHCTITGKKVTIQITDNGVGIEDIEQAKQPLYTTKPEMDRSGMGFTVMETFMDEMDVVSCPGKGTTVTLVKTIA
ncbi:MAG TPA: anti-sigma F factor [Clostridiales bacterium]|nr:anti-sigma F factor [Clostridiales bacterium]